MYKTKNSVYWNTTFTFFFSFPYGNYIQLSESRGNIMVLPNWIRTDVITEETRK